MDASFAGRSFDGSLLRHLPESVDPCGENGEFHTLVFEGPIFTRPLRVEVGEVVSRAGFVFCDVLTKTEKSDLPVEAGKDVPVVGG
jgi:diphthamide synthase (EF-2-diphthine--ammonia ligase)